MSSPFGLLFATLATTLNIYFVLLVVRVLLSWFPNIEWYRQPFATISQLTDPYLNLFRSFIPPLGGLDLSPILAFLLLQAVTQAVGVLAASTAASSLVQM
jgi:YggT family protein